MRRSLAFALKAAISAVLLYFALAGVNPAVLGERLRELKIEWMLGAVALACAQLVLLAARWQQIARACGAPLPLGRAFRLSLIAAFFNQVLPSTVGGDAMRIWLFARAGAGWSKATHSVLLDRFVGVLALALLVVACLPWTFELIQHPVGRTALLVIGLGSISGALTFVALGYLRWAWLQDWAPTRHLTQMAQTARKILFSAGSGGPVMVLSLAIHALTAGIAWCAAHAVDAPIGFFHALQLVPPVMLIATIPISVAGWGVREKSLVLAFAYAGLPETDGFLISVLLGATMFVVGAVGGIAWLSGYGGGKAEAVARVS
jgi:hypothetical protein